MSDGTRITEIETRFHANLDRVRNLVGLYEQITGKSPGRPSVRESDLLRAAVVMLHATLEDLLRSVAESRLPSCAPESLRDIPITGSRDGRDTKVSLVDLAKHRGRTVDEIVKESVDAWLQRCSYNSKEDIATLLNRLQLAGDQLHAHDDVIDAMMKRRHLIAHWADWNEQRGTGHHPARSIGLATMVKWIAAVESFATTLLATLDDPVRT